MNLLSRAQDEPRFSRMDESMWGMILGKSGKLPGEVAPEIKELAKEKGYEFTTADPQSFYPDALVPFENFKLLHHNSIDAGENQGIWVNANIGLDQAPGFYTGSAVLTIDGTEYNVPMELTVYDAQMPEQNHQPSSFDIWWDYITYGEGKYTTEIAQAYFDILVDHRVMPLYPSDGSIAIIDGRVVVKLAEVYVPKQPYEIAYENRK
jgi:hypothetical protein